MTEGRGSSVVLFIRARHLLETARGRRRCRTRHLEFALCHGREFISINETGLRSRVLIMGSRPTRR